MRTELPSPTEWSAVHEPGGFRIGTLAVNWRELLCALHFTHRMTLIDIATAVGSHRDSIRNYYNRATTPSHLMGEKLIALWHTTTGKTRDALPMERPMPSVARARR